MVELYYRLVQGRRRTIDEVPEKHRAEVQALLDSNA